MPHASHCPRRLRKFRPYTQIILWMRNIYIIPVRGICDRHRRIRVDHTVCRLRHGLRRRKVGRRRKLSDRR